MKSLTIFLLLLSSAVLGQTFTANYMIVREMSVDSVVVADARLYEMPTLVDITPKRVKVTNSIVQLDLYGEGILSKKVIVFRNLKGELYVIKITKSGLIILADKEYILTNKLK